MKVLMKSSMKGSSSLSNILHATISFSSSYNINKIWNYSVQIIIIDNRELSILPFPDEVIVDLVHKCVQQIYLLALHSYET